MSKTGSNPIIIVILAALSRLFARVSPPFPWSDGILPFGLKTEDLKREHTSHPRNPYITDVFYRRGLIEQWGRGTQKIVELCVKAGHPEPEFGQQAGSVFVRFRPLARKGVVPLTGEVDGEVERLLRSVHDQMTRLEVQAVLGLNAAVRS